MAVSLKDVAAVAGVSIKTVSNVVHDYPFVSDATRARVRSVIDELGYRPNLSARRLRSGRSGLIALSLPELTPYFTELAEQVVLAGERRGLTVLVDLTRGRRGHERLVAAGIRDNVTDGTIASPLSMTAEDIEQLRRDHPIVLLGERLSNVGVDHVAIDSVAAAASAVRHLVETGRRTIALVGSARRPLGTVAQRQRGYTAAVRAAGLERDRSLFADVVLFHREDGYDATRALLERRPDVDGLFCMNDLLAFGALQALRETGRSVPGDVAVVGFDDVDECRYSVPPLTSVRPDRAAIAEQAVDLLVRRIAKTAPRTPQELLPPYELVVRASTVGAG
jgi:DNA-binding LacI/PurR family transcriptional regulator